MWPRSRTINQSLQTGRQLRHGVVGEDKGKSAKAEKEAND